MHYCQTFAPLLVMLVLPQQRRRMLLLAAPGMFLSSSRDCIFLGYVHWSTQSRSRRRTLYVDRKTWYLFIWSSVVSCRKGGEKTGTQTRTTLRQAGNNRWRVGIVWYGADAQLVWSCTNNNLLPIILGYRVGGSILSNSVFITNQTFQIVLFSIHVTRFRNSQPAEHAQQQTKDKLMILSVTRRRKTSTTLEETLSEYISDVTRKENFAPCPAALFLVSYSRLMGECLCNYFTFQNLRFSCYI